MEYIFTAFAGSRDEVDVLTAKPLKPDDEVYLRQRVLPVMQPLSDDEYMNGPAAILGTAARSSYVLDDVNVFWCVEWQPGFLVVKFSPDATMMWATLRSTNPEFGSREATEEELNAFDEDAEDFQYNLVFRGWDAQFDEDYRLDCQPVDELKKATYEAALSHVDALGENLKRLYSEKEAYDDWMNRCHMSHFWRGDVAMG